MSDPVTPPGRFPSRIPRHEPRGVVQIACISGGDVKALLSAALALGAFWAAAALWIDGPGGAAGAGLAALLVLVCAGIALRVRPFRRAALTVAALVAAVALWWASLPPSNGRDWLDDVARLPRARIDGDRLTIENVRNFSYRSESDYDARWETRSFDLSKLRSLDLFLSQWSSPHIVHTILAWEFEDGPPLAISIETRKERGEQYSALLGFFRQFELYYVVADERDVIGVRASQRGERLRLYRLHVPRERARELLVAYAREIDDLAERPRWYNALTTNCTTVIRDHVRTAAGTMPWSWKILANGHLDELLYERGRIDTSLPFAELRERSDVTDRARAAEGAPDFSARIREGLPGAESVRPGRGGYLPARPGRRDGRDEDTLRPGGARDPLVALLDRRREPLSGPRGARRPL